MRPLLNQFNKKLPLVAAVLVLVSGCSTTTKAPKSSEGATPRAMQDYHKALDLMQAERFDEAELALLRVALDHPDYAGPYVNLGILYARNDRTEKAENAFLEAVKLNPKNAVAYNQLGILYRKQGRFEDADQAYTKAVTAQPDYAIAYLNHGVLYDLYLQQPAAALDRYQRYLELTDDHQSDAIQQVSKWVAELKLRIQSNAKTAQVGE